MKNALRIARAGAAVAVAAATSYGAWVLLYVVADGSALGPASSLANVGVVPVALAAAGRTLEHVATVFRVA